MQFKCEPDAERYVLDFLEKALTHVPSLKQFQDLLLQRTSSRLQDWVDFITAPITALPLELGFVEIAQHLFQHPRAQLPLIKVATQQQLAFHVDSIEHFLLAHGLEREIQGSHMAPLRTTRLWQERGYEVLACERRVLNAVEPTLLSADDIVTIMDGMTLWMTRPRGGVSDEIDFQVAEARAKILVNTIGIEQAAEVVLQAERAYWQGRNRAGQWQKGRQDSLGLGWGNHDHHTFRSSRRYFKRLVQLFETLGFYCRERFYAGKEAGWGAQVMEHKNHRFVLFLDVDLLPDEIDIDFAHQDLPELTHVGTIGLWCGLHGESILSAGMHHLEAQFSFDLLHQDLESAGLGMMKPFSAFPYLHQAFSKGEQWPVSPRRVKSLYNHNLITQDQYEKFVREGAIGSHLENLERNQGYKGFNQKNVSYIIHETDPRNINNRGL